jgi:hypothetical protein
MEFIVWKRLRKSVNTKLRLLQRFLVNQLSHCRCQFLLHMHDVLDVPVQISGSCDRLSAGSQSVIYIERRWYVFSQYFGSFFDIAKCFPASILQYIKNSRCRWSHGGIYQAFFWDVTQCHLADICMRISAKKPAACLHILFPEEGGSILIRNLEIYLPNHMVLQPRILHKYLSSLVAAKLR